MFNFCCEDFHFAELSPTFQRTQVVFSPRFAGFQPARFVLTSKFRNPSGFSTLFQQRFALAPSPYPIAHLPFVPSRPSREIFSRQKSVFIRVIRG
jgi:hypothetical protein